MTEKILTSVETEQIMRRMVILIAGLHLMRKSFIMIIRCDVDWILNRADNPSNIKVTLVDFVLLLTFLPGLEGGIQAYMG